MQGRTVGTAVRAADRMTAAPLQVRRRGAILEIVAGSVVLLSSAALETELAFGRLPREVLGRAPLRVLVGGLGFGATVRGVLDVAALDAKIIVAEKVDAVIDLVLGELADTMPSLGRPTEDPRVRIERTDAFDAMSAAAGLYDAILLDVDNGPEWASFRTNARLYTPAGLAIARAALAPGGMLAVWSGYPADGFLAQLRAAGLLPSRLLLRERGKVRARAYVGVARP
jgi:predicted membrane-bound spermidine synthase